MQAVQSWKGIWHLEPKGVLPYITQGKNCCFVQCALSTTCSESSSVPGKRANAQPKDTEPESSRA